MFKNIKRIIKKIIWQLKNKHNFTSVKGNYFPLDKVTVGKGTYGYVHAVSFGSEAEKLQIGCYCSIADEVTFLLGGEHLTDSISTYPFREKILGQGVARCRGPIIVEDDVWICYGATILSGVTLGKGCIVAAGALVNKDIPPYAVVAGVPARVVKYRFDQPIRNKLYRYDLNSIDSVFIAKHIDLLEKPITKSMLEELDTLLVK